MKDARAYEFKAFSLLPRRSDGFIVAKKWSNAHGAKGATETES